MSQTAKPISKFQDGTPPSDNDDFVFERNNVTYRIPFRALKAALASLVPGNDGLDGEDGLTIPGKDGNTGNPGSTIPGLDGEPGEDSFTIPGKDGATGAQGIPGVGIAGKDGVVILPDDPLEPELILIPGPQGIPGVSTTGVSGKDGAILLPDDPIEPDLVFIPGPTGATGSAGVGTTGTSGITMFHEEIVESDLIFIPGQKGDTGAQGTPGSSGSSSGPLIWILEDPDFSDSLPLFAPFDASDKNVVYLGKIIGIGVTVGPLGWLESFDRIIWEYQIGGYNGGTPVGRILCGSAAISTSALTNGNGLVEGATVNATSVSVPGCPLAVTLSAVARRGWGDIRGISGDLKSISIFGQSGAIAVASSPTVFSARSNFSDLSTNLPIKKLQLTVYDALTGAAPSAQTFTATTYIRAWGIRTKQ